MQTESISNLAKALITFHVKVDKIRKDAKNPFFKSTYASLSNILDSIKEPLIESGLSIVQFPTGENGLTTILMHVSGEWISSEYQMRPVKDDPQGRGSCLTYQRRYCIASVLSLNIDEDDDGNKATHGKSTPDEDDRKWLNENSTEFKKAVKYLQDGGTLAKIKEKYKLNKLVEAELLSITLKTKNNVPTPGGQ